MKTIGLIGGMSWESTAEYYRIINEQINKYMGKHHSSKLVLISLDFEVIEDLMRRGYWKRLSEILVDVAKKLERIGADIVLICTNTMHKVAEDVEARIHIPLLHIADATAENIKAKGLKRVGLLGTRFTMEEGFYKNRLEKRYGIETIVPEAEDREVVHRIIFNELVIGEVRESSRRKFKAIIGRLAGRGAEGIILGCTEIPLLLRQEDSHIPIFDTTLIHASAAVKLALS